MSMYSVLEDEPKSNIVTVVVEPVIDAPVDQTTLKVPLPVSFRSGFDQKPVEFVISVPVVPEVGNDGSTVISCSPDFRNRSGLQLNVMVARPY